MARNNLAYEQEVYEQSYDARPIPSPRPRLRTIEGRARSARTQQQPLVRAIACMSAVVLIVLATVSVARVSVSNATVGVMQASAQTNDAIEQAREVGVELEVEYSLANNPTRIQDSAASLGMLPSSQTATIQAYNGFSASTLEQMRQAASEYQAAQMSQLQAAKKTTTVLKTVPADADAEATTSLEGAVSGGAE